MKILWIYVNTGIAGSYLGLCFFLTVYSSFSMFVIDPCRKLSRFFLFHLEIIDDVDLFQYFVSRGEAYAKRNRENLRKKDE